MRFLADLPSTNLRIFVGVCLAVVYVVGTMLAGAVEGISSWDVLPEKEYVDSLGMFVLVLIGIDTAHFGIKRATQHREGEVVHEVKKETVVESRRGEASNVEG